MKIIIMATIFFVLMSGCATITRGPMKDRVKIESTPSEALVLADDGITKKKTPCFIQFKGPREEIISIQKEGYESTDVILRRRMLSRIWWNLLFWPGFIVDFATDSAWELNPESVNVELTRK
ncbi:MAG: hypothetical protein LHV69_02405 [Elusimicrobia bacterium]|nr:hypothetical protein [Candidatus Obscuribacterium magneticum]MCB4755875.1 hypothetical protein [Candidatus Obscuribacterium magneticum]